jgi:DNA polymerase-3 subunit delta'
MKVAKFLALYPFAEASIEKTIFNKIITKHYNMKKRNTKEINSAPHPRHNHDFFGNEKAVEIIENILNTDKIPQSWLICGQKGIGKATLAYRFAKSLLIGSKTLASDKSSPAVIRIEGGSHSDLLVIEPDEDKASNEISVEQIRKISGFLRLTASETKYRIVIIDSADNMNNAAANVLLKLLEEPPAKSIFLLISHCPGRLLATIKSRCRNLNLNELSDFHASNILQTTIPDITPQENDKLTYLSGGSPGVAIELYYNNGIAIYEKITAVLTTIPHISNVKVQELADIVNKQGDKIAWQMMTYLFDTILMRIIKASASKNANKLLNNTEKEIFTKLLHIKTIEDCLNLREKANSLIADTSRIHLDKRAVITSIFREFV